MSKCCALTGKKVSFGNRVSHSNRKTRRKFSVNLCRVKLNSDLLSKNFNFRIASKTLRTIHKYGGFDNFLIKAKNAKLTTYAKSLKDQLHKLTKPTEEK